MDIGMLWFDDDKKRTLTEKVERAINFYASRYGRLPTECHVHPVTLAADTSLSRVGECRIVPGRNILKDHFWLGIGEPAQSAQEPA